MSNERRHFRKLGSVLAIVTLFVFAANTAHAAESRNRLAQNRLAQNRLAQNRLAQNRLAQNALSSTSLEANQATAELLADAGGRELYSYIISCALPEGITIQAEVPGAANTAPPDTLYTCSSGVCVFQGALGLAEYWIDHKLARKDQRWVSACLFARVNLHDTTEAIALRGTHDSLTVGVDEAELYNVAEGAFYGNLFTDADVPIDMNACRGEGQASGEFGGLNLRDCAEEDPTTPGFTYCGFKYAGDCADYSPEFPSPYACKSVDGVQGTYEDCHAEEGTGQWPSLKTYREVITTYVTGE
jgi:hypothetical protein